MKKAAWLALGLLYVLVVIACPTDPTGPTEASSGIVSEGSQATPVPIEYVGTRACQLDATSPSWYQITLPESYTLRIKIDGITPPLEQGESLDVFIGDDTDSLPSEPAFVVTPANTSSYHDLSFAVGTHYIKVQPTARSIDFAITIGMGSTDTGDEEDDSEDPDNPGNGGEEETDEGSGSGTQSDPWILEPGTTRTLGAPDSGSDRYLAFDAAATGADYNVEIEFLDGAPGGSGDISSANTMQYRFPLDETEFSYSFSAMGDDTAFVLNAVPGDIRVTLTEVEALGRWEPVGDLGFTGADVSGVSMDLAHNPASGELWAATAENRGGSSVIAVYRAGSGNASWTEVTGFPTLVNPSQPTIAVDSQGIVYVGCAASFDDYQYPALYRYNGTSWSSLGDVQYGTNPGPLQLLVDADDTLHVLGSSGDGQGFELYYYTFDGTSLVSVDFPSDIAAYNFDAVLDGDDSVRVGLSWFTPFHVWSIDAGGDDYDGDFIEETDGYDEYTHDRGSVRMAAASDGTPWAILRDTIGVDEHQYRLWKNSASGWSEIYDFPEYSGYSEVEYIRGLAISGSRPAVLSQQGDEAVHSVWWGYEQGEMALLGERWLAYNTLRDIELVSGKDGALYIYGITFTSEDDPADGKLSVYQWNQ